MAQGSVLKIRPIRSFASPATSRVRHVESLAVPGPVSHNWTFGAGHIDLAIGPTNATELAFRANSAPAGPTESITLRDSRSGTGV